MMKAMPRGRPKLPEGERKSVNMNLRIRADQRHAYKQAAKKANMSMAEWITWHLDLIIRCKKHIRR